MQADSEGDQAWRNFRQRFADENPDISLKSVAYRKADVLAWLERNPNATPEEVRQVLLAPDNLIDEGRLGT